MPEMHDHSQVVGKASIGSPAGCTWATSNPRFTTHPFARLPKHQAPSLRRCRNPRRRGFSSSSTPGLLGASSLLEGCSWPQTACEAGSRHGRCPSRPGASFGSLGGWTFVASSGWGGVAAGWLGVHSRRYYCSLLRPQPTAPVSSLLAQILTEKVLRKGARRSTQLRTLRRG